MEKSCKTCEFNFDGVCAGHGNVYEYGETIVDDSKLCDDWSASFEYFTYQTNHAPRFLRDAYNRCCISYQEFSRKFDDFKDGKAVPINFFDAIKAVYGLSMVDIAVLLDVTFGVVYRAKTQGFSSKRIKQFSNALRVPENLLLNTTTGDFEELEQCKKDFFQSYDKKLHFQAMPEWKMRLANDISSAVLHCPIHIAKQLSSVDHLFWTNGMALDAYTEDEIAFIHYLQKTSGKHTPVVRLEYFLDIGARPHMSMSTIKKN